MDYSKYFEKVTLERINDSVLSLQQLREDPEKFLAALHSMDVDLRDALVIRGMMYLCLELNFLMQGEEIWEACELYSAVSELDNTLEEVGPPVGFQYYN